MMPCKISCFGHHHMMFPNNKFHVFGTEKLFSLIKVHYLPQYLYVIYILCFNFRFKWSILTLDSMVIISQVSHALTACFKQLDSLLWPKWPKAALNLSFTHKAFPECNVTSSVKITFTTVKLVFFQVLNDLLFEFLC